MRIILLCTYYVLINQEQLILFVLSESYSSFNDKYTNRTVVPIIVIQKLMLK